MSVGGNLLFNNTGITSIDADVFSGLTVSGNFQVNSNSSLTTIDASAFNGATITGDLQIHSNTSLTSLSSTAFTGATIGGTVSLSGNTSLTSIDDNIVTAFFTEKSTTGDIRMDNLAVTALKEDAFKAATISNDLRIDNNSSLTELPASALQNANVGNNLRIDNTGITKLSAQTFKDTIVGNELCLASNSDLTEIEPTAFYNMQVTGNVDLENTTALTQIPWCAFDAVTVNGVIKLANSGFVNAMEAGSDKTTLTNGATKEQIKTILRKYRSLAAPVKHKDYAEIVKLQNKNLGISSAPAG